MNKCISFLNYRNKIVEEVQSRFSELSSIADNTEVIKYSMPISGIGKFCPSLLNYRIHPNRKCSRLLNDKPKSERYVRYDITKRGEPLRICKFNKYGCDSCTYFYKDNEYICAVPLFRETADDYNKNIYIYKMTDGQINEYVEIDTSSVYLEEYDYLKSNVIICNVYEYFNSDFHNSSPLFNEEKSSDLYSFLGQEVNCTGTKSLNKSNVRINKWKYEITYSDTNNINIHEFTFVDNQWLFNRII